MFEQKSDKKLMTTVVLGWRRAAERGRMERRQGDEMAAAAAAAAAVEEQQMAVKERMVQLDWVTPQTPHLTPHIPLYRYESKSKKKMLPHSTNANSTVRATIEFQGAKDPKAGML